MSQITSGNPVGINQQDLGGGASIDEPAVARDPHLRNKIAVVFTRCLRGHCPKGKELLTSTLLILPQIQPPTTCRFHVENSHSGSSLGFVDIPANRDLSLHDLLQQELLKKSQSDPFLLSFNVVLSERKHIVEKEDNREVTREILVNRILSVEEVNNIGFTLGGNIALRISPVRDTQREAVVAMVSQNGLALRYAPDHLRANKAVVLAAVSQIGWALLSASQALRADKEVVLAAVRKNGLALGYASEALKADKEVVLAAVRQTGEALGYASEALKADKEVVFAAVANYGLMLVFASEALRADRDVVLAAVAENGGALGDAGKEATIAVVSQNGQALQHASEALKADKDVVLAAVRQNGLALEHASAELQIDGDLLLVANPGWTST